ncbi:flagellar biosynthetic protein FliO [Oceanobacillus sp. J11TS1]|uniref:flagellar biosynthetic protein FliO n=1 Tax=Oceanobacillus sp. J11TS1 TaxID=2807191 RepID=UPI001B10B5EC|nr:flagellar biosynthetic protein FliO [Oceanobacillus sp. J11TS1]GIO21979.1 hypothetical protein J11TS1_05600 [Oceanobacillus sp. J11TS1]
MIYMLLPVPANAEANVLECLENDEECTEPLNNNGEQPDRNDQNNSEENNGELLIEDDTSNPSMFGQIVRLIVGLVLVLGLVYVVLKLLGKKNGFNQQTNILRNVGGISVGSNKSIQIIRVGKKYYLVGVGDNVELLEEINDPETIELMDQRTEKDLDASSFFLKGKKEKANKSDQSFDQLLTRELKSIRKNRQDLIKKHKDDVNE